VVVVAAHLGAVAAQEVIAQAQELLEAVHLLNQY
jgi:endonuclease/exonuclease/phosphatase family metal-dependent hydrolase